MEQEAEQILQDLTKQWESLTITNDFVFGKVMLDEELCREVLEAILAVPIERIEYVGREDDLDETPAGKSVRLDVHVRDGEGTVYNVEIAGHEYARAAPAHALLPFHAHVRAALQGRFVSLPSRCLRDIHLRLRSFWQGSQGILVPEYVLGRRQSCPGRWNAYDLPGGIRARGAQQGRAD